MNGEDEYKYGEIVDARDDWNLAIKRVRWAVRKAGYQVPKVQWYFHRWIHWRNPPSEARWKSIGGMAWANKKSCTVKVAVGPRRTAPESTMIHEMAHAVSSLVEDDYRAHEHSDLWGLVSARIYRWYFDHDYEGPPRPRPYYWHPEHI